MGSYDAEGCSAVIFKGFQGGHQLNPCEAVLTAVFLANSCHFLSLAFNWTMVHMVAIHMAQMMGNEVSFIPPIEYCKKKRDSYLSLQDCPNAFSLTLVHI